MQPRLTRFTTALFALSTLLFSVFSYANVQPYDDTVFAKLLDNGEPVLIDVSATWCSTCKKQAKVIDTYFNENPDSQLTVLKVDYDSQKAAVKRFNARRQSTLVLYIDGNEVSRAIAKTNKKRLFAMFAKADS